MNYKSMINEICNIIITKKINHPNWVIIGGNSSGKSDLLHEIVENISGDKYYIDSVNRFFDVKEATLKDEEDSYIENPTNVVSKRIRVDKFNLKDSFGENYQIGRLYPKYKDRLVELLYKFLNIKFEVKRIKLGEWEGESEPKVFVDGIEWRMSNGYQAIFRILAELIYYTEVCDMSGTIIIDEIDEFLSRKNASDILTFLIEEFEMVRFVISTHSSDLIANSRDFNLVVLGDGLYNIFDGNDFKTLTDVDTLLIKIYKEEVNNIDNDLDLTLERLLNMKIAGCWSSNEDVLLKSIDINKLTNIQKYLFKQIERWEC